MKISPNREYVLRHLGVALLMTGLTGWFAFDGAITYPKLSDAEFTAKILHGADGPDFPAKRRAATNRQFQFAGLSGLAALLIALGVLRVKFQTLSWDETAMNGSLTGNSPLAFADVASIDDHRWPTKGILVLTAKDGRRVTLDAWHHAGVKELVREKLLHARSGSH